MNKALIGSIAGLLVLGGTAVGGSLYADQQLTDKAYSPELMQRSFGLANFQAQTNLGILSGSAQWQGDLILDPCQPGDKVTIRGNDTIHRSLSGYRIDSKIYIVSDSKQFNTYFPEGFLLNVRRHIGWGGNVQTSFNLPGRTIQKDSNTLTWQDINGQVSLNKENNELIPTEFQFTIPAIEFKSGQTSFSLQNLSHRSQNSFLGHGKLQTGSSETTLAALTFISSPGNSIVFSQIKTTGTQSINGPTTSWGSAFNIQRIDITQQGHRYDNNTSQSAGSKHSIEGLQLNSNFNGLNTQAMQSFSDLISRQRSVCIPRAEFKTKLSEITTAMLNSGLSIQAQGNQIKLDGFPLTADAELILPPGQYGNIENIRPEALAQNLQYRADIRIHQGFIQAANHTFADWSNSSYNEDDTRQIIAKLLQLPEAKQEGDTIRLIYRKP